MKHSSCEVNLVIFAQVNVENNAENVDYDVSKFRVDGIHNFEFLASVCVADDVHLLAGPIRMRSDE